MYSCFFCSEPAEYDYKGNGDHRLWLCTGHWHLMGEFFIEAFEEAAIIAPVEFLEDCPPPVRDPQFWWRTLVGLFVAFAFMGGVAWVTNFMGFRHGLG